MFLQRGFQRCSVSGQRTDDLRRWGGQTCGEGVRPWLVITKELMFKHRQTRSWHSDKYADPLSHRSSQVLGTRGTLDLLELLTDGSRISEETVIRHRSVMCVFFWCTQVAKQPAITQSDFHQKCVYMKDFAVSDRNPKNDSRKSHFFLVGGGRCHRCRQERWGYLQGLPAGRHFNSHDRMHILTV